MKIRRVVTSHDDKGKAIVAIDEVSRAAPARVSRESEPLRHASCGTPVEARWYCPTCDRPVEGQEAEQIRRV